MGYAVYRLAFGAGVTLACARSFPYEVMLEIWVIFCCFLKICWLYIAQQLHRLHQSRGSVVALAAETPSCPMLRKQVVNKESTKQTV